MTPLERTRPCPTCGTPTAQVLEPVAAGAQWRCKAGGHVVQVYTHDDMRELLQTVAERFPRPAQPPPPSIEGVRVFVETLEGEEGELDEPFLREHVECARALPTPGKPLLRRVQGLPAPFNTVSYGKVLRVERNPHPDE